MDINDQIKALMPDLINGKTHEQLKEELLAEDKKFNSHYVDGVKLPWMVPASNIKAMKTLDVRDDDVFINSFPRSGTHWVAEIVNYIVNGGKDDFDRSFMTIALEFTLASSPSKLESVKPGYQVVAGLKSPRCVVTHCMEAFLPQQIWKKQAKVVYVARNPKDVLVSIDKLMGTGKPTEAIPFLSNFEELLWKFYFGETLCGSWFDHVLNAWNIRDHPNVLFLKYEDLKKDLRGSICKIAKHLGKDLLDDVIDGIVERVTFSGMQKTYEQLEETRGEEGKQMTHAMGTNPHLRKGQVGDWKNTITVAQSALFDKVYALKMQGTDLKFDFEP